MCASALWISALQLCASKSCDPACAGGSGASKMAQYTRSRRQEPIAAHYADALRQTVKKVAG
jgi:hypothetical protein